MRTARLQRRRVLMIGCVALLMAGCSSSDNASDTATTTAAPATTTTTTVATAIAATTTTRPATTTTVVDDLFAADKVLARAALLTIDDFPDGWIELPVEENEQSESDEDFQRRFDVCLGVDGVDSVGDRLDGREVETGEFTPDGGTTSVTQEVLLADDEAMAIEAMLEVGVEGASTCMQETIQSFFESELADDPDFAAEFPAGMTIGEITVERVESDMDPTVAVEYLTTIPLELDGDVALSMLDVVYFRQGRALSQLQFQSFDEPFDPEGLAFLGGRVLDNLQVIGG